MKLLNRIRYYRWKDTKRSLKFFWQRRTRGWDDSETWSLDHSLGKLIAPRLKRLRDITIGVPGDMNGQEWTDHLNKMIAAFEFAGSEQRWHAGSKEYEQHREGLELFAKHYFALWW